MTTWVWDGPTLIGLAGIILAILGMGGRLCWLAKRAFTQHEELMEHLRRASGTNDRSPPFCKGGSMT